MNVSKETVSSGLGLAIASFAAIISTLLVNTLSNFFPPGGQNVGEIANTVLSGVLITPANYAFAIWGLIYLGLIAYGIYQLGPNQRRSKTIQRVNWLLIVACIAQMIWIFLFTLKSFALSVGAMLVILLSLIGAYLALQADRSAVNRQRRWFAQYPFSIYLAWISVATVVNVASFLYVAEWNGFGLDGNVWTAVMIFVSAVIAGLVVLTRQDFPFALVFVWAYGAIAVRHSDVSLIWGSAVVAGVALLGLLGIRQIQRS
ncbi:MAG: TspO/MBR family protein [Microcoleaceae cyanobacterium]